MGFTLEAHDDHAVPVARCDRCEGVATAGGFVLWDTQMHAELRGAPIRVACGSDCLDELIEQSASPDTWAAISLDAYLASLVRALDIDIDGVLTREQAALAAERTRDESPE